MSSLEPKDSRCFKSRVLDLTLVSVGEVKGKFQGLPVAGVEVTALGGIIRRSDRFFVVSCEWVLNGRHLPSSGVTAFDSY